jgi:hypothetical protein
MDDHWLSRECDMELTDDSALDTEPTAPTYGYDVLYSVILC